MQYKLGAPFVLVHTIQKQKKKQYCIRLIRIGMTPPAPNMEEKLPNLPNIDRVIISVPALLQKNHRLVWNRTGKQWTIFQNYHIQRRNDSESSCSKRSGTSTRIILHIFLNSRDKRPQVTKI